MHGSPVRTGLRGRSRPSNLIRVMPARGSIVSHPSSPANADVLVVGAGVIGLGIAWRCRQRGLSVTVVDPAPGSGASTTAAGMLAPVTELQLRRSRTAARSGSSRPAATPTSPPSSTDATGIDIGYRRCRHGGRGLGRRRPRVAARSARAADLARPDGRTDHRTRTARTRTRARAGSAGWPVRSRRPPGRQPPAARRRCWPRVGSESIVTERVTALVGDQRITGVELADGRELSARRCRARRGRLVRVRSTRYRSGR